MDRLKLLFLAPVLALTFSLSAHAYLGGQSIDAKTRPEIFFFRIHESDSKATKRERAWKKGSASEILNVPGLCTATQIRPRIFLTAAHCVAGLLPEMSQSREPVQVELGKLDRPDSVWTSVRNLSRWAWTAEAQDLSKGSPALFRGRDVAVFEVDAPLDGNSANGNEAIIFVSDAAPEAGAQLQIAGFGQPLITQIQGLKIQDQRGEIRPGQLRADTRKVAKIESSTYFLLAAHREITRSFVRSAEFVPMSKFYPGSKPTRPDELAAWDETQFQQRIAKPNRYNHLVPGDSGGPAYVTREDGAIEILGINSMVLSTQQLKAEAPDRIPPGFDPAAPSVDFIARVDAASPGGKWLREMLKKWGVLRQ